MSDLKLSDAFAAAAREATAKLAEGESRVREAGDLEGVHLMRTSARRLRAAVKHLGGHLPRADRARLQSGLKSLMTVLSPVRDLDVLAGAVDEASPLAGPELQGLKETARLELIGPLRLMSEYLDGAEYRGLREALESAAAASGGTRTAVSAAPGRIAKALETALERRPADWSAATDDALHELRKDIKRLRYALEAFRPAYGKPVGEMIARCRELQEALGAVQDAAAFGAVLRGHRTFAAGQFLASVRIRASGVRERLPELWKRAMGPKMLGRLGEHLLRRAARAPAEDPEQAGAPSVEAA